MKTIEDLAREAGMEFDDELEPQPIWYVDKESLAKFASLVRAAVVEELVAGSGEPVDFSDVPEHAHVWGYTADQLAAAVLRERERCAKVCEAMCGSEWVSIEAGNECAAAIRGQA